MLRGILALNSSPLLLDEDTIARLEEDDVMRKLLSEGKSPKRYYAYNEAVLRDSFTLPDSKERTRILLQLRKNSLYPAQEVVSETDAFTDFIKHYQVSQLHKQQLKSDHSGTCSKFGKEI